VLGQCNKNRRYSKYIQSKWAENVNVKVTWKNVKADGILLCMYL